MRRCTRRRRRTSLAPMPATWCRATQATNCRPRSPLTSQLRLASHGGPSSVTPSAASSVCPFIWRCVWDLCRNLSTNSFPLTVTDVDTGQGEIDLFPEHDTMIIRHLIPDAAQIRHNSLSRPGLCADRLHECARKKIAEVSPAANFLSGLPSYKHEV